MSRQDDHTTMSCVDCAVTACRYGRDNYPDFCLTKALSPEDKAAALAEYHKDEEIARCSVCSTAVEGEFYGEMARVEETMEFARRIGAKKIGLAYCEEMAWEAELYTKILRLNGFDAVPVSCRVGQLDQGEALDGQPNGRVMCNPIGQALVLNREESDFNILMGLCVGSDTLFIRNAAAVTTVMINKDRLTANNPVATLYRPERRKLL